MRSHKTAGFTLLELMIVVSIVGVLAALAMPAFRGYVMRTRTAEAPTFLGEIRQREEAYFAEFYQYAAVASNPSAPSIDLQAFDSSATDWQMLGAVPDGPLRFSYSVTVGTPGSPPPGGIPGLNGNNFEFASQAIGDLDGDGNFMCFEGYSSSRRLYLGSGANCAGGPLPTEWE